MTNGYWLGPNAREYEVHESPLHSHAAKAIEVLGGESNVNPVLALLKKDWVRISCDTISVWEMDGEKGRRIAAFVRHHAEFYRRNPVVFVEDESSGTTLRMNWRSLARLRPRRQ